MTALKRMMRGPNGPEGEETPVTALGRIGEEMERAIDRFWHMPWQSPWTLLSEWTPWAELQPSMPWPAIDVAEDDKMLTVRADLPGIESKDVTVEILGNELTIRGSREEEKTEKGVDFSRHERRFGRFERTVRLPSYVDAEKIEAKCEKGTLTITVPKIEGQGPKRVPVKSG